MLPTDGHAVTIGETSLDELRRRCREQPGTLFAILDACDEPRVPAKVGELGPERAVSLYRGWAEREYWAITPYLVQVDEPLLDWIVETLGKDPWGILLIADTQLAALRKHFRRFLVVEDAQGAKMYFRFYDPRVIDEFIGALSREEAEHFFGAVGTVLVKRPDVTLLRTYRPRLESRSNAHPL